MYKNVIHYIFKKNLEISKNHISSTKGIYVSTSPLSLGSDGGTHCRQDKRMQPGDGHLMPVAVMVAPAAVAVGGTGR